MLWWGDGGAWGCVVQGCGVGRRQGLGTSALEDFGFWGSGLWGHQAWGREALRCLRILGLVTSRNRDITSWGH